MPGSSHHCLCAAHLGLESWRLSRPAQAAPLPLPSPRLLMSLVFSSNHSSYNTGQGEAKNSSLSHMMAPNAEAPSKGTRATPCFLGNESHCDACRQAAANAARTACKGTLFPVTSLYVTGEERGHEEDRAPKTGRSMAWCLGVRARSYLLLSGVIGPQDKGCLTPGRSYSHPVYWRVGKGLLC